MSQQSVFLLYINLLKVIWVSHCFWITDKIRKHKAITDRSKQSKSKMFEDISQEREKYLVEIKAESDQCYTEVLDDAEVLRCFLLLI